MYKEFEQVIENNQGRIRYIASRYCQNHDFEDIYQEILMQLWRSYSSFKGQSSIETWLYKVALNTACTFVSKSIKHKELQQVLSEVIKPESQSGQENCQAEILNSFMNTLSDTDANILMMYLDGFTSEEITEVVGISANAVRLRIKRIKTTFEDQYIGEEK
ncbi:MAG: sigma-70 family RNA polymerase sigma factor [Gammaproteobacteria bacterium]|jgi:RNA polymerase sigma-70 factor (ECF subfamily)|nr:sigma-70 family RNA polymerase sigma factor [Gammaproteobacteria bacterium]MBT3723555.1 sigma-70 family RNA polymerase sigma factor [Gammaproteobacteria bacterium]MBT4076854.1 sigma-70 family RNA polymerase sigma factor [Gammaproteobacteria bacterium]MBT4192869.1 sigma-70 family RNA polymerase sigma factor [Gammaproteobacteria bacterium]MBT4452270.1 sigma-70 family RNA polymerase sigma factor [Gammaproteobacteria bacterium]